MKIKAEGYDKRNQINDPYPLQHSIYLQLLKVFLAIAERPTAKTSKIAENNRFKNTMNMYFHFSVNLVVLLFLQRESVFCEKEMKPSGSVPFQFQSSLMNYGSYVFMKTFQTRRKGQGQMAHSKVDELMVDLEKTMDLVAMENGVKLVALVNRNLNKWGGCATFSVLYGRR